MDYRAICGVASYAVTLIGLLMYARSMERPSIATWAIWTLNSFLLPLSYHRLGAEHTVWLAAGYATGCFIITLLAIKVRGEIKWTKIELICLGAVLIATMLWWITGSALVAFSIALVIDLVGITPTIENAWKQPHEEPRLAWILMFAGGILSVFAVKAWDFDMSTLIDASYPIQIAITAGTIVVLLSRPRSTAPTS